MIANYSHKWWYYAISVLLIIATLLLLIYSPFHHANALVASGVVIAAVLAALAAFGITTVVSGMTSAQVTDYIDGKLNEWATFKGSPIEDLIQGNLITKTASNLFAIGASAANGIREFIQWLVEDEQLTDNSTITLYESLGNYITAVNTVTFPISLTKTELQDSGNYLYTKGNYQYYLVNDIEFDIIAYKVNTINHFIAISDSQLTLKYETRGNYYAGSVEYSPTAYTMTLNNTTNYYYRELAVADSPNSVAFTVNQTSLVDSINDYINNKKDAQQLVANTSILDIPNAVANEDNLYLDVGAPSVANVSGLADWVLGEVEANSLTATYEVDTAPPVTTVGDVNIESISTGAISSIQSAVQSAIQSAIQQSEAIQVNTDHHILGFTLPSFDLNLSGIWHYVHDAVGTASTFINFLKGMLTSVPWLAIPLYMSFTLIVVLGVFRRFLL